MRRNCQGPGVRVRGNLSTARSLGSSRVAVPWSVLPSAATADTVWIVSSQALSTMSVTGSRTCRTTVSAPANVQAVRSGVSRS